MDNLPSEKNEEQLKNLEKKINRIKYKKWIFRQILRQL